MTGAVLSLFTLGAVGTFALSQYRKMKKELPDDREVRPEDKIAVKQSLAKNDPVQQTSASHGTPSRQPA
ncbi:hypothetical protein NAP1_11138 [Erythrobacter sp. NAP1]|uniref:hypothetical protein n=1 Tax=Erythrobacter sp. NAP1 TaxID=237727 RepID=UPI0000687714|nr:hypothetical protein [Erythrobacter sp. NAP1]EAQ28145.1 hypothetical protein NAP1_11138 [Erythrobacter sp. NAP1]